MADEFKAFASNDSSGVFQQGLETLKKGMSDVAVAGALRDAQVAVDQARESSADEFEFYKQTRAIQNQTALRLGASGADAAKINAISSSFESEPTALEGQTKLQGERQEFEMGQQGREHQLKREENELNRDLKRELAEQNKLTKAAQQKVPAGTVEKITSLDNYISKAEKLKELLKDPKVKKQLGLKNVGGFNEVYQRVAGGDKQTQRAFNTLNTLLNDVARASTGAQRSFAELAWLKDLLPKMTDNPESFATILETGLEDVKKHKETYLTNLEAAGHAKAGNLRGGTQQQEAPKAPPAGGSKYFIKD